MTLDKTATANYSTMSDLSSNVPKVRLHDTMLNIKSKTGHEEVPPRRREKSSNLSTNSEIRNMIRTFETDINELNEQSLNKCQSLFASIENNI